MIEQALASAPAAKTTVRRTMATAVWVRSFRRRSLSVALFFRCDRKPLLGISKLKARKRRRTERCAPRIDNNNRLTQKKSTSARRCCRRSCFLREKNDDTAPECRFLSPPKSRTISKETTEYNSDIEQLQHGTISSVIFLFKKKLVNDE